MTYDYGDSVYLDDKKLGVVVDPAKLTKAQLLAAVESFENHAVYLSRGKARIFDTDYHGYSTERGEPFPKKDPVPKKEPV
jgi:hypothetical protein